MHTAGPELPDRSVAVSSVPFPLMASQGSACSSAFSHRSLVAERAIRRPTAAPGGPLWPGAGYEAVMWSVMSAAGREEFLAGVRVGVLSTAVGKTGRTLAVPVWYSYQPGGLVTVLTSRRSRKAGAIRAAGRFGLCAQDGNPPYRYVTVEGPGCQRGGTRSRRAARDGPPLPGLPGR